MYRKLNLFLATIIFSLSFPGFDEIGKRELLTEALLAYACMLTSLKEEEILHRFALFEPIKNLLFLHFYKIDDVTKYR